MKSKVNSSLEVCSRCHEISDLAGKKICFWCEIEQEHKDVYSLPPNCVDSLDGGDEL